MSYSLGFSQALEILFYIALKRQSGTSSKYLTIKQISDKINIPVPSVKRLIGLFKRDGFIESKKGVNGGLLLTKDPENINAYDVFKAVEGDISLFKQHDNFELESFIHKNEVKYMLEQQDRVFMNAEQALIKELKNFTLADFFS